MLAVSYFSFGVETGTAARLEKVLGVEGAMELDESEFSPAWLSFNFQRTVDGKARATATSQGAPSSFFLRVRMK